MFEHSGAFFFKLKIDALALPEINQRMKIDWVTWVLGVRGEPDKIIWNDYLNVVYWKGKIIISPL